MLATITDKPEGDIEEAKQVLRDAGWGQDDDGNWHYPPDADLSPRWPKDGKPSASEFPCLTKEGKYSG
jgi:peptide/nickel transport system substrate-binding protein